jgi:hypothetical protein
MKKKPQAWWMYDPTHNAQFTQSISGMVIKLSQIREQSIIRGWAGAGAKIYGGTGACMGFFETHFF